MANITFDDGSGSTSIASTGIPAPGDRLAGWSPGANIIRAEAVGLGNGITYGFEFRRDRHARFSIRYIKASALDALLRFQEWAESGGAFTVNTADAAARSYACVLLAGTRVEITEPDDFNEYAVTLTAKSTAGSRMICVY